MHTCICMAYMHARSTVPGTVYLVQRTPTGVQYLVQVPVLRIAVVLHRDAHNSIVNILQYSLP